MVGEWIAVIFNLQRMDKILVNKIEKVAIATDASEPRVFLVWLICLVLISVIALAGVSQLIYSHRIAIDNATQSASARSFLVAEWINKSFDLAQYVLRETANNFQSEELVYPPQDRDQHEHQSALLIERVTRTPNLVFLGMLNRDCVVTHTSIGINLGYDALKHEREYCELARQEPFNGFKVSNMFTSVDGTMNITISYPLLSDNGELEGFALAGLDLDFFQQWLDLIELEPYNVVTIYDLNSRLLARNPFIEKNIGIQVIEEHLNRIAETKSKTPFAHRLISPVDGIDRIWSLRKIGDLPFIVVVGEQTTLAMGTWRQMMLMYLIAGSVLCLSILFGTYEYIRNCHQAAKMRQLATLDPLTGLWNRRYFTDIATNIIARAQRSGSPLVLIMMDLDYFKNINDTFGHSLGDKVLHDVAQAMKKISRKGDVIARWGGEEFIILLPDTDVENAISFYERLRAQMSAIDTGTDLRITSSQGITEFKEKDSLESMIKRADDALYLAKTHGRDRFEMG